VQKTQALRDITCIVQTTTSYPQMSNFQRLPRALRIFMKEGISEDGPSIITVYMSPNEFEEYNNYLVSNNLQAPPMPGENEFGVDMLRRKNIIVTQVVTRTKFSKGGKLEGAETLMVRNRNVEVKWQEGVWILTFPVEILSGSYYVHTSKRPVNKADRKGTETMVIEPHQVAQYVDPSIEIFTLNLTGSKTNAALIQIMDMNGKVIMNTSVPGSSRTVTLGFA
jgi:hypothetical protein